MNEDEKRQTSFRCQECNLIPIINYYLDECKKDIIAQKISLYVIIGHPAYYWAPLFLIKFFI